MVRRGDSLAEDRTHLANKRTLLAYWRTALAFIALGAFMIKFIQTKYSVVLAFISIAFGVVLFIYGPFTYRKHKRNIINRVL